MGGEQKLRNLETVRFKAIGQRNMLEQSERLPLLARRLNTNPRSGPPGRRTLLTRPTGRCRCDSGVFLPEVCIDYVGDVLSEPLLDGEDLG